MIENSEVLFSVLGATVSQTKKKENGLNRGTEISERHVGCAQDIRKDKEKIGRRGE